MKRIILSLAVLTVVLGSCDSGSNHSKAEHHEDHVESPQAEVKDSLETPPSVYNNSTTLIGFGAFKTTERKEVKGWFKSVKMSGITESNDVAEIFKNASIEVDVSSLETRDAGRNATLLSEFFSKTSSNELITGKVVSFNTDSATAVLLLNFNGVEKELGFDYTLTGDTLSMQSVLKLADVNGLEALASLHKACEVWHKGNDGVSKTWDDVKIYVATVLRR